jgi:hypothetical protein
MQCRRYRVKASVLILRSVASSAFTRVFDALWRRVSKDEDGLMLRDARFARSSA